MSDITLMEAAIALDEARSDLAEAKAQVSRLEYYKLHHEVLEPAIDQMGGWANFKHWITRHSVSYFKTCENLEAKLKDAEAVIGHFIEYDGDELGASDYYRPAKEYYEKYKDK